MKRYNLLIVLFLLIFNVTSAQSSVFGSITEAKSKIEATVPVVLEHLKTVSASQKDESIYENGKTALKKQYNDLSAEFNLYKGNLANCIVNKNKKATTKCMNYHTQYFRNTLGTYGNYINYTTKKNGYLGVDDDSVKLDFKPTEIATMIDKDFAASAGVIKKMKGNNKMTYFDQLNSDEFKLQNFDTLAK